MQSEQSIRSQASQPDEHVAADLTRFCDGISFSVLDGLGRG